MLVKSNVFRNVKLEDFKLLKLLGKGSSGKVYLAEFIKNNELYAIKSIRKDRILEKQQLHNIKSEKEILLMVDHPNLVSMHCLF